jgi:hypothetical protein
MAKGSDVLTMLIPTGGWVIYGDDFDSIIYDEGVKPITKTEFTAGFAKVDAHKAEQVMAQAAQKAEILKRIGITADEAALLLS